MTDESWHTRPIHAFAWPVPRISSQQAWEEQFDARKVESSDMSLDTHPWVHASFDDRHWSPAKVDRPAGIAPHAVLEPRDIPQLTRDPVAAERLLCVDVVKPAPITFTLNPKPLVNPNDLTENETHARMLLVTHIHSDKEQPIELHPPHDRPAVQWKLNGVELAFDRRGLQSTDTGVAAARLQAGWNVLMAKLPECELYWWAELSCWVEQGVRFAALPAEPEALDDPPWLTLGPFEVGELATDFGAAGPLITAQHIEPEATAARYHAIWERGELTTEDRCATFTGRLPSEMAPSQNVYARCASDRVVEGVVARVDDAEAMLADNAQWTVVHPTPEGDVRLRIDFGCERVGFHEFEVDAPAGTTIDAHNFEFIQPDGRVNLCEQMHNSFGYVCREGLQRYRTFVRRGFRYTDLTLRRFDRPVRLRMVRAIESTYPMTGRGDFTCSDLMLERIWHVGVHTLRCCAEDTYTDCPTYEQVHWVGDARNEALIDLVTSGDPRLSAHCWLQVARSLDHTDTGLVESHVPSGWRNVLPAWCFLWMSWAEEHFVLTGDHDFAAMALPWLDRAAHGIETHLDNDGLFSIRAWNMFDWAPMDTPNEGVVTHQNCLAVMALNKSAELAAAVGDESLATRWRAVAATLSERINRKLWCESKSAYTDCIRADGVLSPVFSQQTQTAAFISGVAQGERAALCREAITQPSAEFVTAGSPFFMSFLLEVLASEGRTDAMVEEIVRYWRPQIEAGATTFWEMYHPEAERMTRSHCHGWSAMPTFYLTQQVLGVRPASAGYDRMLLAPRPGGLRWARGRVPTPRGTVSIGWRCEEDAFTMDATLPGGGDAAIDLPMRGELTVEQGQVEPDENGLLLTRSPRVKLSVR